MKRGWALVVLIVLLGCQLLGCQKDAEMPGPSVGQLVTSVYGLRIALGVVCACGPVVARTRASAQRSRPVVRPDFDMTDPP